MPQGEGVPRIGLVIADDHPMVRRGLAAFVEMADDIELLAAVSSGDAAIEAVERNAADVLLLDLLMPGHDARHTVRTVKTVSPRTEVIILTSHEGAEYIADLTVAGACSYILKDTPPNALIETVRKAHAGERTITLRIARTLLAATAEDSAARHLTPREWEVLRAIASGHSNRTIAADLEITERTVKSHVSNILSKLYLEDRTQAAVYAWREGWVSKVRKE